MRRYDIKLSDPVTGKVVREWSSLKADGMTNLGALNVEYDIPVCYLDLIQGTALVRIWGISLQDIGQAADFNKLDIEVSGGFAKGLPLANPSQYRLLTKGMVWQAFGNWQGTDQTLDLQLAPSTGSMSNQVAPENGPKDIILNQQPGQTLAEALQTTLTNALPALTFAPVISPSLVLNVVNVGFFATLTQLATHVRELSKQIINDPDYQGVGISISGDTVSVTDGYQGPPDNPIQIEFNDLIGQITWIGFNQISFKCAMRGDLQVGDWIKIPRGQITTSAQSFSQFRNGPIFTGTFRINSIRHIGNFREPNANAWVTVFEALLFGAG